MAVFVELYQKREALKRQTQALLHAHEELEDRVRARTRELAETNHSLREEIDERKRIEAERLILLESEQSARAKAEAVNRLKDEFLATLSHELRTPLNAILGWSHLLSSGKSDKAMVERAIGVIRNNALAQSQLIEDILDVSRIIGGKLRLKLARVQMRTVIEAALDSVSPAAQAKAIVIEREIEDIDAIVGDQDRLQQVVWNLLSNAVKFTPREGRVAVRLQRRGDDVVFAVEDTGIGITPHFLPYVFDRFTPGRWHRDPPPWRARPRHGDRPPSRRAARRHGQGGERRRESGRDLHHRCCRSASRSRTTSSSTEAQSRGRQSTRQSSSYPAWTA